MLDDLKSEVYDANLELVKKKLVIYTWGNVSGIDRKSGLVVIKPSGVSYELLKPSDMVVVDLNSGKTVEGKYKPSSDTETHLELYKSFPDIGGVTHTHSINAVAFSQAGIDIPPLGTTHADYFYGSVPCTRVLRSEEIKYQYELNTGKVIVECFESRGIDPKSVPGVLVNNHGPFSWGENAMKSVFYSVVIDVIAEMAIKTLMLNNHASINNDILDKHYFRKHGSSAYYGQNWTSKEQ